MFGGKRVVKGEMEGNSDKHDIRGRPPDYVSTKNNVYLNDLWVWEVDHERWSRIKASGLTPSPRADMGQLSIDCLVFQSWSSHAFASTLMEQSMCPK